MHLASFRRGDCKPPICFAQRKGGFAQAYRSADDAQRGNPKNNMRQGYGQRRCFTAPFNDNQCTRARSSQLHQSHYSLSVKDQIRNTYHGDNLRRDIVVHTSSQYHRTTRDSQSSGTIPLCWRTFQRLRL
ncbi:hypothetical protein IG631_03947 [Alternaria alternata]|nr:hypothetical protein IG631_03947 [Alternaria alternata]